MSHRYKQPPSAASVASARAVEALAKPKSHPAAPPKPKWEPVITQAAGSIKNPVEVWNEQYWVKVAKDSLDFPIVLKQTITPEFARDVMQKRNTMNRTLNWPRVEKYMRDIHAGDFATINNGIGFYEDGTLADGQHRLSAIAEAGMPCRVFVTFGMEKKDVAAIDEGRPRSNFDVAKLLGIEATKSGLSTANYILEYKGVKTRSSRTELLSFYERHKEAIDFVATRLNAKRLTKAPVMAAIARAWYNVSKPRLEEFITILNDGKYNNSADEAAYKLREWLLLGADKNTGSARAEVYRKTEAAIVNFIAGKSFTRLFGTKEEQFPLPEEKI